MEKIYSWIEGMRTQVGEVREDEQRGKRERDDDISKLKRKGRKKGRRREKGGKATT